MKYKFLLFLLAIFNSFPAPNTKKKYLRSIKICLDPNSKFKLAYVRPQSHNPDADKVNFSNNVTKLEAGKNNGCQNFKIPEHFNPKTDDLFVTSIQAQGDGEAFTFDAEFDTDGKIENGLYIPMRECKNVESLDQEFYLLESDTQPTDKDKNWIYDKKSKKYFTISCKQAVKIKAASKPNQAKNLS